MTNENPASPAAPGTLSRRAKSAVEKYGRDRCLDAYRAHRAGDGARTIAFEHYLPNTSAADAAIDAGRELAALDGGEQAAREVAFDREHASHE
jgi:hypothetical protein